MRIAAYQFAVSGDINENYGKIVRAINTAKSKSVQLVVFPECALTGYPPRDVQSSSEIDFNLVKIKCSQLQKLADENDISFLVGTIYKDNGVRNRAILFRPGMPCDFYDKKALWGWDKDNLVPGSKDGIFEVGGISIGVRICFEIRFPEYFRQLFRRYLSAYERHLSYCLKACGDSHPDVLSRVVTIEMMSDGNILPFTS